MGHKEVLREYTVLHPEYGQAVVIAAGVESALLQAAARWEDKLVRIAKDCEVIAGRKLDGGRI